MPGNDYNPDAVWERIGEAAEHGQVKALPSLHAIADELVATDAPDLVDDSWVLSDHAWTDWLFAGADEKRRG